MSLGYPVGQTENKNVILLDTKLGTILSPSTFPCKCNLVFWFSNLKNKIHTTFVECDWNSLLEVGKKKTTNTPSWICVIIIFFMYKPVLLVKGFWDWLKFSYVSLSLAWAMCGAAYGPHSRFAIRNQVRWPRRFLLVLHSLEMLSKSSAFFCCCCSQLTVNQRIQFRELKTCWGFCSCSSSFCYFFQFSPVRESCKCCLCLPMCDMRWWYLCTALGEVPRISIEF